MPRIVALDVGDARIGVAATDELGLAAHPVRTIQRTKSIKADVAAIAELLEELEASKVVVGLPVQWKAESGERRVQKGREPLPCPSPKKGGEEEGPHPSPSPARGEEGVQAGKVREFFDRLARRVRIPVVLWDETLSTVEAEEILLEADVSRAKRRKVIDQMAAVVILNSYLQSGSVG